MSKVIPFNLAYEVEQLEYRCVKLEAQNAELLKALEWIAKQYDDSKPAIHYRLTQCASDAYAMSAWARTAIAKAKGGTDETT